MGLRNVLRYRRRSVISGFAIVVCVFVMMCLRGLVNGSETMVFEQLVNGQFGAVQVHKKGFSANVQKSPLAFAFPIDEALMTKVRAIPGVRAAAARIMLASMTSSDDKSVPTPIMAIDPKHEYEVCPLKAKDVFEGKPVSEDTVVMSPQLRKQLGLSLGGEITLLSQDQEGVMNASVLKAGGFLADIPLLTTSKKLLFVPLGAAQQLLRIEGQALEIVIASNDYMAADELKTRVVAALGPEYEVDTWRDKAAFMVDSLADRRVILNWVTSIFLVIALIGITNTMLMSVLGRMREIGTMMAVGMKRRQIITLFIAEAAVLGVLGSIVGLLLGDALVSWFHFRGFSITVPGQAAPLLLRPFVEWQYMARIGALVAGGCVVASIYPAFRAAKLKPIEAMGAL
jgi:putative ABC transport system permease protein